MTETIDPIAVPAARSGTVVTVPDPLASSVFAALLATVLGSAGRPEFVADSSPWPPSGTGSPSPWTPSPGAMSDIAGAAAGFIDATGSGTQRAVTFPHAMPAEPQLPAASGPMPNRSLQEWATTEERAAPAEPAALPGSMTDSRLPGRAFPFFVHAGAPVRAEAMVSPPPPLALPSDDGAQIPYSEVGPTEPLAAQPGTELAPAAEASPSAATARAEPPIPALLRAFADGAVALRAQRVGTGKGQSVGAAPAVPSAASAPGRSMEAAPNRQPSSPPAAGLAAVDADPAPLSADRQWPADPAAGATESLAVAGRVAEGPSAPTVQPSRLPVYVGVRPSELPALAMHALAHARQRIVVALEPAELGRVRVSVEFAPDGRVQVKLRIQKEEALERLQREAGSFARIFAAHGFELGPQGLAFERGDEERSPDEGGDRPETDGQNGRRAATEFAAVLERLFDLRT
ncbi:hypothetical protein HRbin40_00516 [bacterium HR40]|nr:hypothetical protein HRbin40_00516 [bacterium HR40]